MKLLLTSAQVEAIAEDLYRQDANRYMPVWKAKKSEWRLAEKQLGRQDPLEEVRRMRDLINKHKP